MKIRRVKFTYFRCFIDNEFDFCDSAGNIRPFTLLIGENSAGKTAVLEGIVKGFVPILLYINKKAGDKANLTNMDINVEKTWTSTELDVKFDGKEFSWFNSRRLSTAVQDWIGTPAKSQKDIKDYISKELMTESGFRSVPLVLYYSTARIVLDVPMRAKNATIENPIQALNNCLSINNNFRKFFEWFKTEEENELRMMREDRTYRSRGLEAVRNSIRRMMNGYSNLQIKPHPRRMVITSPEGKELRIEQLSGGYKAILSLVSDIASRLAQANPNAENPLDCSALILIDELDMHLHPRWQRTIAHNLKQAFPNCQFIATTHSPSVVQSLTADEVLNLQGDYTYSDNYGGWTVDEILEYEMGVEKPKAQIYLDIMELFEEALDAEDVEQAKKEYFKLKSMLHPSSEMRKLLSLQLASIGGETGD